MIELAGVMASKSWDHWDPKFFGDFYAACGHLRAMSDKCAEAVYIDEGPTSADPTLDRR